MVTQSGSLTIKEEKRTPVVSDFENHAVDSNPLKLAHTYEAGELSSNVLCLSTTGGISLV